jgi:DHA2 family methylenomycin A resistance protein-like MFS transporter
MVLLDTTVLTVALPDIGRDLHVGVTGLQWVTDAYLLPFAACLLTAGALADRWGGDRVFRAGTGAFGALSLVSAAAPTTATLVALRGLLGLAGAALLPSSLALIALAFPDPARRARAIGTWAAITGAALAAGPLVGGLLVGAYGWRSVFLVNAPVAAASLLLCRRHLPPCPRSRRPLDGPGQVLCFAGLFAGTWALVRGGAAGWSGSGVALAAGVAALAGAGLVVVERRSAAPMLPPALLARRTVGWALAAGTGVNFALSGGLFVSTLLLQQDRALGSVATGAAFLPLTLPTAFNPLLTGRLVARVGPRGPVLAGLLATALSAAVLAATAGRPAYLPTAVAFALLGLGVSLSIPALTAAAVTAAPAGTAGIAAGALNASRQAGAVVGVALLGSITAAAPTLARGVQRAELVVLGVLLVLAAGWALGTRRTGEGGAG